MADQGPVPGRVRRIFYGREPAPEVVLQWIEAHAGDAPSFQAGGFFEAAPGWIHDRHEGLLGSTEAAWQEARRALQAWKMFEQSWLRLEAGSRPPFEGQAVAILAQLLGLWWLSLSKVIRVYDESDRDSERFGLIYATLEPHAVVGQERFEVHRDRRSGEVRFLIEAVSRPSRWFLWPGYPLLRRTQKRFARGAIEAMRRAVRGDGDPASTTS